MVGVGRLDSHHERLIGGFSGETRVLKETTVKDSCIGIGNFITRCFLQNPGSFKTGIVQCRKLYNWNSCIEKNTIHSFFSWALSNLKIRLVGHPRNFREVIHSAKIGALNDIH